MRATTGKVEINYATEGSGSPITLVHGVGANL